MSKYLIINKIKFVFIILVMAIFLQFSFSKSYAEENVFIIDNIVVEDEIDINFSREKYINEAFSKSFEVLRSRILLLKDSNKISDIKIKKIKNLISNFKILEETYKKDIYKATFKIIYNENKVREFLQQKNISFTQQKKISAVFFPILFANNEMQDFYENFFYKQWTSIGIKNELIEFILPLEDLDDIAKIKQMKNRIEELNADDFVNKYNIKNYVFVLMNQHNKQLSMHVKTNFHNIKTTKNITYKLNNLNDEAKLKVILKDLKMQVTEIWKKENLINLSIPLSLKIRFEYKNLQDLDKLKNIFQKINIINNYFLEEFNINSSLFKINYYGNPKKLKTELLRFGFHLKNEQGYWELYANE